MKLKRKFTIGWIVIMVQFVVWEMIGVFSPDKGDTFSEHVWVLLGVGAVVWLPLAAFMIWAFLHFMSNGKFDDWLMRWFRKR